MKRILAILALLVLFSGERASAQLVSGGGGGGGGGTSIIGGACTNPQFMQSISTTGVPTCNTPAGGGFTAGGDLSGTSSSQTVIGIQNKAVPTPASGFLQYTGTVFQWGAPVTSIVAGTGLTGGTITTTGTIALSTPVSVANGGTNNTTAPTAAQILVASNTTTFAPVTVSGDSTITTAGVTTNTGLKGIAVPTLASGYLHYNGSAFVWDVPGGGFAAGGDLSGTATTQTVIGIQTKAVPTPASGYLHYNGSAFVWDTPTGTFTAGGDLSGTSTSQTVVGIQTKAVPTPASGYLHYNGTAFVWDTPGSGTFAPLVNPTSGQNNYAPIESPTLTASSAQALQIVSSGGQPQTTLCGVVVFPDGGTVGTGGWNITNLTVNTPNGYIYVDSYNHNANIEVQTTATISALWDKNGIYKLPALQIGTAAGTPAGAGVNIASGAGTYMYAGSAIGGTCAGGQFFTSFSGTGAIACGAAVTSVTVGTGLSGGTITGTGTISLSSPVSIANGGTGTTTAPSAGQMLIAQSSSSYLPETISGDVTTTTSGVHTVGGIKGTSVPALASGYLHYTGSAFAWDTPSVTVTLNTYTPVLGAIGGTNPTVTYTTQKGVYYTIGNVVHFSVYLVWSAYSRGTGAVDTVSLPFTQSSGTGSLAWIPCVVWQNINLGTSMTYMGMEVGNGNNFGYLQGSGNNTTGAPGVNINNMSTGTGYLACEGWGWTGTL